jgi:hypothetical protein
MQYGRSFTQFILKASIQQKNTKKLLNMLNGCGTSFTVSALTTYSKIIRCYTPSGEESQKMCVQPVCFITYKNERNVKALEI